MTTRWFIYAISEEEEIVYIGRTISDAEGHRFDEAWRDL